MGVMECFIKEEMVILKSVVKEVVNLVGVIYVGDFIFLFDIYDFMGYKKKINKLVVKMFDIVIQLIEKYKFDVGIGVDNDKLNLVDILLFQKGED